MVGFHIQLRGNVIDSCVKLSIIVAGEWFDIHGIFEKKSRIPHVHRRWECLFQQEARLIDVHFSIFFNPSKGLIETI